MKGQKDNEWKLSQITFGKFDIYQDNDEDDYWKKMENNNGGKKDTVYIFDKNGKFVEQFNTKCRGWQICSEHVKSLKSAHMGGPKFLCKKSGNIPVIKALLETLTKDLEKDEKKDLQPCNNKNKMNYTCVINQRDEELKEDEEQDQEKCKIKAKEFKKKQGNREENTKKRKEMKAKRKEEKMKKRNEMIVKRKEERKKKCKEENNEKADVSVKNGNQNGMDHSEHEMGKTMKCKKDGEGKRVGGIKQGRANRKKNKRKGKKDGNGKEDEEN